MPTHKYRRETDAAHRSQFFIEWGPISLHPTELAGSDKTASKLGLLFITSK